MTSKLRFKVIHERNVTLSMEMSFFAGNRGMSFFAICPLNKGDCKVPKNGMNCNQSMNIVCGFDSSRFSGQLSKHNKACPGATLHITFLACKEHMLSVALTIVIASQVWARGIAKKDIPLFLICIASQQKGIQQKKTSPCSGIEFFWRICRHPLKNAVFFLDPI